MTDDNLLKIRVELGKRIYEQDLEQVLKFNSDIDGLNAALAGQPGTFAWWATLEVMARAQYDALEEAVKDEESRIFIQTHEEEAAKIKGDPSKLTVDGIKAKVRLDPAWQDLNKRRLLAKRDLEQLVVARKAIEQRRDALITTASNTRAEMEYKLTVAHTTQRALIAGRPGMPPRPGGIA